MPENSSNDIDADADRNVDQTDNENPTDEYNFEVSKNTDGISISVYNGLKLVEETWRTWNELGVERTDSFDGATSLFELSLPRDSQNEV